MKQRVFISLGSNLGDRRKNLEEAIKRLEKTSGVRVVASSGFYETTPVKTPEQIRAHEKIPSFFNAAVEIETELSCEKLLGLLQKIEEEMGRVRNGKKWEPRIIDLDIIFYGTQVTHEANLKIPHPEAHKRRFVLEPLCDIAPEFVHPVQKKKISQLISELA